MTTSFAPIFRLSQQLNHEDKHVRKRAKKCIKELRSGQRNELRSLGSTLYHNPARLRDPYWQENSKSLLQQLKVMESPDYQFRKEGF